MTAIKYNHREVMVLRVFTVSVYLSKKYVWMQFAGCRCASIILSRRQFKARLVHLVTRVVLLLLGIAVADRNISTKISYQRNCLE